MAEGWAKRWIQDRKASASTSTSASTVAMEERDLLEDIVVASVALDAASVFGAAASSSCSETTCCGDRCETVAERKLVKSMAVQAMSLDGVDISTHVPKTVEELAASLASSSSSSTTKTHALRKQEPHFQNKHEPENSQHGDMMMDKLIVLCSCGDEMKSQLVRRSVSVEEWNVDAPTAAAQSGEGASAYRRVSQDIRLKVDTLMEQIVNEKKQQQQHMQHMQQQHELRIEREREHQQVNIAMEDVLTSEAAGAVLSGKEIVGN